VQAGDLGVNPGILGGVLGQQRLLHGAGLISQLAAGRGGGLSPASSCQVDEGEWAQMAPGAEPLCGMTLAHKGFSTSIK